jgi:hypothetical protein
MADDHENEDALRAVANRYYETACQNLTNDGHLEFATIVRKEGREMAIILFNDDGTLVENKDDIEDYMRSLAPDCTWIAQIAEVYVLTGVYNTALVVSEHRDRAEAIFVTVQSRQGTYLITSVFERDEQGDPLTPTIQTEQFLSYGDSDLLLSGRMSNYYNDSFLPNETVR